MKKNNSPLHGSNVWLFILMLAAALALILWLKYSAAKPGGEAADNADAERAALPVAIPDTSVAPGTLPAVAESITIAPADDIGRDNRPADEAGEEDGYWDGYYDGSQGRDNNAESLSAPPYTTAVARDTYAANYREGYRRGYDEGCRNRKTIAADRQ